MKPEIGRFRRIVEIAANIAIVVVAIFIVGNFLLPRLRSKPKISAPAIDSNVSLAGVDWQKNGNTLVMVLQKGCRFCEESAPFYQRLHAQRSGPQPRLLAVIPGDRAETVRYLSDLGILADEVVNSSLADIGIGATPTLMLVDQSGRVRNTWVGKLDEKREKEVETALSPH